MMWMWYDSLSFSNLSHSFEISKAASTKLGPTISRRIRRVSPKKKKNCWMLLYLWLKMWGSKLISLMWSKQISTDHNGSRSIQLWDYSIEFAVIPLDDRSLQIYNTSIFELQHSSFFPIVAWFLEILLESSRSKRVMLILEWKKKSITLRKKNKMTESINPVSSLLQSSLENISTLQTIFNRQSSHRVHYKVPMIITQNIQQYPFSYDSNQMWPEENWNSWNKVFKLIFLSFVSTIGSLGSIFIISAITVIDTFQVRSNCYLVSLAFGHLLMTILVLPASALIIIADIKEETSICHFQWLITLSCFIVSVLSYLCLSIDNLFSLKSTTNYHLCCSRWRIFLILLLMWFAAFFLPFIQHTNRFGPEFCSDKRDWKIASGFHLWILGELRWWWWW